MKALPVLRYKGHIIKIGILRIKIFPYPGIFPIYFILWWYKTKSNAREVLSQTTKS